MRYLKYIEAINLSNLNEINISLSADVANQKSRSSYGAIYMICCVSRAKMYFQGRKFDESWGFRLFFSIFLFSKFWMVLWCFCYKFWFPDVISCPEMMTDRSGIEFQAYVKIEPLANVIRLIFFDSVLAV